MTIPVERSRAVVETRKFLFDLIDPARTPRVPRDVRERAHRVLRHYPWTGDIEISARDCPEIWGME